MQQKQLMANLGLLLNPVETLLATYQTKPCWPRLREACSRPRQAAGLGRSVALRSSPVFLAIVVVMVVAE